MSETKFHKAAKEGYIDLLHEATKHDANKRDEDGMTPTLYAAFNCNLDALRVLISRRGDPDKCDLFGSSALHFVCSRGDMNCCTYLVSFGANVFVLDNDFHTPLEIASLKGHTQVVRFLDDHIARLTHKNARSVKKKKDEEALKARDRIKKFEKLTARAQKQAEKEDRHGDRGERKQSVGTLKSMTARSTRGDYKAGEQTFSDMTKASARGAKGKIEKKQRTVANGAEFRVSERDETGKRSVRTIQGGVRGSEGVMYVGKPAHQQARGLTDLFDHDSQRTSSNDYAQDYREGPGLFTIPNMGDRFFIQKPQTEMLGSLPSVQPSLDGSKYTEADNPPSDLPWEPDVIDEDSFSSPLQTFLASCQLPQYLSACRAESIGLDALMLCTDQDLQAAGIKIGHRRIILNAVERRDRCLSHPGPMNDLSL